MKLNWGKSIFLFYIIFVGLCVTFIVFSLRQNNDLVTEDYYEKGADYSTQIEINKRSSTYADSITLMPRKGQVSFVFCESLCQLTDTLNVYFFRPSDKILDVKLKIPLNDTVFLYSSDQLIHGRYIAQITWTSQELNYQVDKDIRIE